MARPTLVHLWHVAPPHADARAACSARRLGLRLLLAPRHRVRAEPPPAVASPPAPLHFQRRRLWRQGQRVDKDTRAIRDAIAAVAAAGSGVVLFPSGGTYLTAPFNVTSHCTLYLAKARRCSAAATSRTGPRSLHADVRASQKGGSARRMSFIHGSISKTSSSRVPTAQSTCRAVSGKSTS